MHGICNKFVALLLVAVFLLTLFLSNTAGIYDARIMMKRECARLSDPTIAQIIANISKQELYHWNYELQNFTTRFVYTINFNQSAQYIYNLFASFGLTPQYDYFYHGGWMMRNVIAVLPGLNRTNDTVYVIGGHFDSIWYVDSSQNSYNDPYHPAPGADDDGSGTVVMLEVAKVLSHYRFEHTIIFAAWGAEEIGLVGSNHFATEAYNNRMNIGGYLNLDMVGNDANPNDTIYALNVGQDQSSVWLADIFTDANTTYNIGLKLTRTPAGSGSDHASFLKYGYPAIFLIERDFSPHWHQTTDNVSNMNFELVKRTAQAAAGTMATLAGVKPPSTGSIYLNRSAYRPMDLVEITLYDTDLDTTSAPDTVQVSIISNRDQKFLTLTETAGNSKIFVGTIQLGGSGLQVADGDIIQAKYFDISHAIWRIASASVDGECPHIWNVAAQPEVENVTISWQTDEPATSYIAYGTGLPLSGSAMDRKFVIMHSLTISGLQPNTNYLFAIGSTDRAGNIIIDDNGGAYYGFRTLEGFVSRPGAGYAYWVRQRTPNDRFVDGRLRVGYGGYSYICHGAFQLNLTMPVSYTILSAELRLYGQNSDYVSWGGTWTLKMLAPSIDANFPAHNYNDIHNAVPEATILPQLHDTDLRARKWNTFTFAMSQYPYLQNHIRNGRISFRLDGPTGPGQNIFDWDAGYGENSIGVLYGPTLCIRYTSTGDTTGPVVTAAMLTPNPTRGSSEVLLNGTVSDHTTGGSKISAAEYFIGPDPGVGKGLPLSAEDGTFSSVTETFQTKLNVSGLTPGCYNVGIRARDSAGNWGVMTSVTLIVGFGVNASWHYLFASRGWYLLSIPLLPGGEVRTIFHKLEGFYDEVRWFDGSRWKTFIPTRADGNELNIINPTMGLWVHITAACNLTLNGTKPLRTVIALNKGWNLIGYPSFVNRSVAEVFGSSWNSIVDRIEGYSPTAKYLLRRLSASDVLKTGSGYWVHVLSNLNLIIDW